MGLTCSLLGHDWDDPTTEREREQRGDEVITTVREVQVCTRCDERSVVSENTEVRSAEPDPDPEPAGTPGDDGTGSAPTPTRDAPDADATVGGAGVDAGFGDVDAEYEGVEDDAVILEDEPVEPSERQPGEWPSAEDTRLDELDAPVDDEPSVTDAVGGADAAGSAEPVDAAAGDEAPDAASAVVDENGSHDGSDWPDPGRSDADAGSGGPGSGIARAAPTSTPEPTDEIDVDATFVCPACEFHAPSMNASLREGDICPECQRGYLTEQRRTRN